MHINGTFRCLRAAMNEWRPHTILGGNWSNPVFTGSQLAINEIIMKELGTCLEYVIPKDLTYGNKMKNGSWTGMIGLLTRGEADLSGVVLSMDYVRNSDIDFSAPLYTDEFIFAYRRPLLESDLSGFVKPFSSLLWGMFFGSMCLVIGVILLTHMGYQRLQDLSRRAETKAKTDHVMIQEGMVWNAVSWSLGSFLYQSCPWWPRSNSSRIVSGLWLMAVLIIGSLYRSTLKAMLILPKVDLPFDTMNELLESGIYTFVTDGSMLHQAVKEAPEGSSLNLLSKKMITHTDNLKVLRDLNAGAYAVTIGSFSIYYAIHATYSVTKTCPIYIAKEKFFGGTTLALAFPKGSPLLEDVNRIIVSLREFGILNHILLENLRYAGVCLGIDPRKPASSSQRPMDLKSFYGLFSIYAGGMILGILVFVLEVLVKTSNPGTSLKLATSH